MAAAQYATREMLKAALDVKETSRSNVQLDRALVSASRSLEGQLHRLFYPATATKYFDWPNTQRARPWRLWFNQPDQLISVSLFTSGGTTVSASDYFLEPANDGPPYDRLEIDLASTASLAATTGTHQRSLGITGDWGFRADTERVGAVSGALNSSSTTPTFTATGIVGVGDILLVESERMIVTERTFADSTQNLGAPGLTAVNSATSVVVTTGSAFLVGQVILIESEKLLITDVVSNTLLVKRAWDGTALAAHTAGVDVYAQTGLVVARGQLGSTAASHADLTAAYRYVFPGLVVDLCVAEAMTQLGQEWAGYGRTVGAGENAREASGKGIADLRCRAFDAYGRQARMRTV